MIAADGFFPRLPGSHSQGLPLSSWRATVFSVVLQYCTILCGARFSDIWYLIVLESHRSQLPGSRRLLQYSTVRLPGPYSIQYSTVQYSLTVELPTQGYIYYKATFGASEVAFSETDEAFFFFSGGHFSKTKKGMFVSTSSHSRGVTQW